MSGTAINVTPITRVFGCSQSEYENIHGSDPSGVLNPADYDEYTLYLANEQVPVNESTLKYSNLYYGTRKVTDFIVLDKLTRPTSPPPGYSLKDIIKDTIGNNTYPNDKIYLVPRLGELPWKLNGEVKVQPVGYDIYFKHDGIVTPISTSVISEINYDYNDGSLVLSFTTQNQDDPPAIYKIQSTEAILSHLSNLSPEVLSNLSAQIYSQISDTIVSSLSGPIATNVISTIRDNHSLAIADLSDGNRVTSLESTSSQHTTDISSIKTKLGYSEMVSDGESRTLYGMVKENATTISTNMSSVTSSINTINGNIASINTTISGIESTIGDSSTPNTILGRLHDNEEAISTITSQLSSLTNTVNSHTESISDIVSDAGDLSDDLSSLESRVSTNETNISGLTSGLSSEVTRSEGKDTSHDSSISSINSDITSIYGSIVVNNIV